MIDGLLLISAANLRQMQDEEGARISSWVCFEL